MSSSGNKLNCKVILLDDAVQNYQLQRKSLGIQLYSHVFTELKLVETDYFGLQYTNAASTAEWLDKEKTILSQIGNTGSDRNLTFKLKVKFYTSEPAVLEHDLTRYFFALQIKQDLATGQLSCNDNTAAILCSYIVQSELGDFYYQANDHDYLKTIRLLPNQSDEIEDKIAEYHKALRGLSVVESEFQLLEVARKTEMYGVIPYSCHNSEGISVNLAVTHSGIHSLINGIKSMSYTWINIRKLGFKRKRFLIKLNPGGSKAKSDAVAEFCFLSRDAAKAFWKLSVEHHSFFKKLEIQPTRRSRHALLSRGSSFRYNGRTQTQLVEQMKQKWGQSTFDRSMSLRNFPSTSATNRFGKSATFNTRQELGVMTLDRPPRNNTKLAVPSASQATLESRYSGSYDTSPQGVTTTNSLLPASHSLSAIASLATSNGRFDLKSSSTFLSKQDEERDSHRDSLAVVEDNRVELERLVEQINHDLTSAQQAKSGDTNSDTGAKNDTASAIEQFLSTTSQPVLAASRLQLKQITKHDEREDKPQDGKQQHEMLTVTADVNEVVDKSHQLVKQPLLTERSRTPSITAGYTVSDDDNLEMLLTEQGKVSSGTDPDTGISKNLLVGSHDSKTIQEEKPHEVTVNDLLDQLSVAADDSLVLAINENDLRPDFSEIEASKPKMRTDRKDSDDKDLVFRSACEISMPAAVRRSRTRSRQEEMDDLQGLSQLAEQVFTSDKDDLKTQKSLELSELATQVLDFCTDTNNEQKPQLSDLSELLAHYDTIKQQQERINQRSTLQRQEHVNSLIQPSPTNSLNNTTELSLDGHGTESADKTELLLQTPIERTKRKPLIRPALPALISPTERLLDWSTDSYKSDWMNSQNSFRRGLRITDRNGMVDSGIEVVESKKEKPKMECSNSSKNSSELNQSEESSLSDGYSSETEDSAHTSVISSKLICDPLAR